MASEKIKIDPQDLKVRKYFSRDPSEKVELPKKGAPYLRPKTKKDLERQLEEELSENEDLEFNF